IGIYAWRYGHLPEGHDVSITELELDRAIERGIPILVFTPHKDHPLTIDMIEPGDAARAKLAALKERAVKGRGRLEFTSPVEVRGQVIQSLADLLRRWAQACDTPAPLQLHPPNIIARAPEPYVAHPYSLLQTSDVVGRQTELNQLT